MNVENLITDNIKKLETLGIKIPKELDISEIINGFLNMPKDFIEDMEESQLIGMLLSNIGHGKFDFTDWSWEPLSDQIYSFDMEVFNTSCMYTTFLQGVRAITDGDLNITDISEDCSKVDFENGCGTQTIQFRCNGKAYQYDASVTRMPPRQSSRLPRPASTPWLRSSRMAPTLPNWRVRCRRTPAVPVAAAFCLG